MSPQEFSERMAEYEKMSSGDPEAAHYRADELMLSVLRSLGYWEGCDRFEMMERWYA